MTVVMCLGLGLKNINYLKPSLKKRKRMHSYYIPWVVFIPGTF